MSRQAYASFVTVVSKAALGLALTAWHTSSQAGVGAGGAWISPAVDHLPQRPRPRKLEPMRLDRMTLGARIYSNEPKPPYVQGFLRGDVAEDLFYDRAPTDAEAAAVRGCLDAKHPGLTDVLRTVPATGGRRLETVKNPPRFQMLVPGFDVFELPSVRTDGDRLRVGLTTGAEVVLPRSDVEEMKPTGISTMPEGLPAAIGPENLKHLMAFLVQKPSAPAPIHRDDAPPPRTKAGWEAATKGRGAPVDAAAKPLRITLAAGVKDHGIDEHDYPLWLDRWSKLLRSAPGVTVREVKEGDGLEFADESDVIVWNSMNATWSVDRAGKLRAYLDRGGGPVVIHFAVNGGKAPDALADLIGLAWGPGAKFRHGPLDLTFTDPKSPIVAGLPPTLHLIDESYWNLRGDASRIDVLAAAPEEDAPRPLLWTRRQGKGRVFVSIPGHYTWTFDDPLFRLIHLRAISWTADQSVDRLIDLATEGARLE